jgi:hypothetical protein
MDIEGELAKAEIDKGAIDENLKIWEPHSSSQQENFTLNEETISLDDRCTSNLNSQF